MSPKFIYQSIVAASLLLGILVVFIVQMIIVYKNRLHKHFIEQQRLVFEFEKKELSLGINERELILSEISQDIHDNVGQVAHLIRMNLYTIDDLCTQASQHELITYVSELLNRMITDLRYIGQSLNSDFIRSQGLYKMLELDLERINASKQLNCFIDIEGEGPVITEEAQLSIYRIAQEAIHNVLQHADATLLEIRLVFSNKIFKMTIRDDGIGFSEDNIKEKGTMGIKNMYQRAALLQGALDISSLSGKGCCITLDYHTDKK